MIFDADDFGCNHEISNMCQSHDCRDVLLKLKEINPNFKATLFAIPAEMTIELLQWSTINNSWIELGIHGFKHDSNYECEKWTYKQMDNAMSLVANFGAFAKLFKAPGWQISDDCFKWLADKGWSVADKSYNTERRPENLKAYVNEEGNNMRVWTPGVGFGAYLPATHHHTWNCVGNGVYEQFDYLVDLVKNTDDWKFVSEAISEKA